MVQTKFKLGEMLIQAGIIDQNQLMHALERQRMWGGKLGSNLVQLGFVKEEQLMDFLSQKLMIPGVSLSKITVPPEVLKILSLEQVEKFCVLPLEIKGKTLSLAMADPADLQTLSALQFATGLTIKPFVALETSIREATNRYYRGVETQKVTMMPELSPIEVIKSDTEMVLTHIEPPKTPPPPSTAPAPPAEVKSKSSPFPTEAVLRAAVKLLIRKGIITYEELKEEVKKEEGQ
jgi:type IV pilus assembly protein PilB